MDRYDNPAGRLYALLSRLREVNPQASLGSAWAQVLEVAEADLALLLGGVAQLIPDLQSAVTTLGDDAYVTMVERYRGAWASAIFPQGQPFSAALKQVGLPPVESMEALAVVSSHLHREASEGRVPSRDKVADLQASITGLLDDVRDSDLPDEVKHLVLRRLQDVLEALGHLSMTGPAAVRFAIEALMGGVAVAFSDTNPSSVWSTPAWRKVVAVLAATYTVFSAGPTVEASLKAWPHVERMVLGTGSDSPQTPPEEDR